MNCGGETRNGGIESGAPRPWRLEVSDGALADLRERLTRTRLPNEIVGDAGWTYGTQPSYLRTLVDYWLSSYDWRAAEAAINALSHFKADVDGLELHFVHRRGKGPRPLPLLISHGWPGSFYEMMQVIGPLS